MTVKMTKRQNPDVLIRVDAPCDWTLKNISKSTHQQINASAH
jgi:hypothetical protein